VIAIRYELAGIPGIWHEQCLNPAWQASVRLFV
jgi:hypothetical protein